MTSLKEEREVFVSTVLQLNQVSSDLEDIRLGKIDLEAIRMQLRDCQRKVESAAAMLRQYIWSMEAEIIQKYPERSDKSKFKSEF